MIRVMLTAVVAVAIGFFAGYRTARDGDQAARTAAPVRVGRPVAEPVSRRATLTPADVELLKRELVSAIAHSTTAAPSQVEQLAATPQSETDEAIAASESLQDVLDRAVANGAWTNEDAIAMNGLMRRASPYAVDKAVRSLAAAVNDQRLRIDTEGFPF